MRHARIDDEPASHDATDQSLRRGLPIQQHHGCGGGGKCRSIDRVPGNRVLGAAFDDAMRMRIFEPLGMIRTTFDFATALNGNVAQPHGEDADGKQSRAGMDHNRSIIPARPAGGVSTNAHDMPGYVQLELALRDSFPAGSG